MIRPVEHLHDSLPVSPTRLRRTQPQRHTPSMRSLKRQLILWLVSLLTLISIAAAGFSYHLELEETNALMDNQLMHIARSVDEGSQLPAMRERFMHENEQQRAEDFVIQVWMNGLPVRTSRPDFPLPRALRNGFSIQRLPGNGGGDAWRAYTMYYPDRVVQISQDENVRLDIARQAALRALVPDLLLIPLSWLLIGLIVSRLLEPLEAITEAAAQRRLDSLEPLPRDNIPIEVEPLIASINTLVSRLSQALNAQRRFLSDAAHELRTPLTALQLQIDNLAHSPNQQELDLRIDEMRRGVHRATHLVAQLLRISRYEAAQATTRREPVDLNACMRSLLADIVPLADHRHIDLGLTRDDAVSLYSIAEDLRVLLSNLLDNAIRYTPQYGRVDIRIERTPDTAIVEIADTGPGIPPHLHTRVFDRFFRAAGQDTEGSGIGLAIVKAIVEREQGYITLANRIEGSGLIARVVLPLSTESRPSEEHAASFKQSLRDKTSH